MKTEQCTYYGGVMVRRGDLIEPPVDSPLYPQSYVVLAVYGGDYCPLCSALAYGFENVPSNKAVFRARAVRLKDSPVRPLRGVKTAVLQKLYNDRVPEAVREWTIRQGYIENGYTGYE